MKPTFEPYSPSDAQVTHLLRSLPPRVPPANLTATLMSLAARERQRVIGASSSACNMVWNTGLATRTRFETGFRGLTGLQKVLDRLQMGMENIMRPLAVPFAGGVFSAAALFGLWVVPAYPVLAGAGGAGRADVPTALNTVAKIKYTSGTIGVSGADVVVEIIVDGQGRMVEYMIVSGGQNLSDQRIRSGLENLLLFTEFVPATGFGKPKAGRVRLSLSSSSINVKG